MLPSGFDGSLFPLSPLDQWRWSWTKKVEVVLDKKGEKGNGEGGKQATLCTNSDCIVNLSSSTELSNFEVTVMKNHCHEKSLLKEETTIFVLLLITYLHDK